MRFLLVDASHLAHRCRHAQVGNLSTRAGQPSGVVYGFIRGLDFAARQTNVDIRHVIVVWDGGHAAKRIELLPSYKSGRRKPDATPEEIAEKKAFYAQLAALRQGLTFLGTRSVQVDGTEADDLISLLAQACVDRGDSAVVYSGDKDLQQLMGPSIGIFHPQHGHLGAQWFFEKWKITDPPDLVKLIAMIGDKSDDIPGVPTVGEARAPKVLPWWSFVWNDEPKPEACENKVWGWVEKCRAHRDALSRNIKMISLPRKWEESFYGIDVAIEVARQLKDTTTRNIAEFFKWCNEWELHDLSFSHL